MSRAKSFAAFEEYRERYPFHATAPSSVCSEKLSERVYGFHASVILEEGVRTFMFQTNAARQRFCGTFKGATAS